ncbi:MAG: cell division protein ZipA [Gammaproteobacteria bacterium]|jgi:cell division protein ZipA|nr:cell division protein ZipA [Gammaproteobacteria bacterium]
MDLTIRDWMVIIGVLLIVAVLLDAWRRIKSESRSRVKVKLVDPDEIPGDRAEDLSWLKELPNGGARVVERGDLLKAAGLSSAAAQAHASDPPDDDLLEGMNSLDESDDETLEWLAQEAPEGATPASTPPPAGKLPRAPEPEVFMLNVVARSPNGFRGEDILHILLACDLRFGDMSFFHRHEYEAGRGAIQFSVANMMQPGVFDIDNMAQLNTPGLVFFVTLPGPDDMMKAYDYMLETAQAVARNLGGDVLDESRSVLTRQAMEHSRQQIRELGQRMLAQTR